MASAVDSCPPGTPSCVSPELADRLDEESSPEQSLPSSEDHSTPAAAARPSGAPCPAAPSPVPGLSRARARPRSSPPPLTRAQADFLAAGLAFFEDFTPPPGYVRTLERLARRAARLALQPRPAGAGWRRRVAGRARRADNHAPRVLVPVKGSLLQSSPAAPRADAAGRRAAYLLRHSSGGSRGRETRGGTAGAVGLRGEHRAQARGYGRKLAAHRARVQGAARAGAQSQEESCVVPRGAERAGAGGERSHCAALVTQPTKAHTEERRRGTLLASQPRRRGRRSRLLRKQRRAGVRPRSRSAHLFQRGGSICTM